MHSTVLGVWDSAVNKVYIMLFLRNSHLDFIVNIVLIVREWFENII